MRRWHGLRSAQRLDCAYSNNSHPSLDQYGRVGADVRYISICCTLSRPALREDEPARKAGPAVSGACFEYPQENGAADANLPTPCLTPYPYSAGLHGISEHLQPAGSCHDGHSVHAYRCTRPGHPDGNIQFFLRLLAFACAKQPFRADNQRKPRN